MKRWFLTFLTFAVFFGTPQQASADVSGLVPCKDSAVFKKRLDGSVAKLTSRLENYEEGTPAYLALKEQIGRTEARFDKYGKQGLLCGADGAHSWVRRFFKMGRPKEMMIGFQIEVTGYEGDEGRLDMYTGRDIAPGYFAWAIPSGGGIVRHMVATEDGNLVLACSAVNGIAQVYIAT